jgi:hypothetical protein
MLKGTVHQGLDKMIGDSRPTLEPPDSLFAFKPEKGDCYR